MKLLDKLKYQVIKAAKAPGKNKLLFTFKKEHYKKNLTSKEGFGAQDLKPTYFELVLFMYKKYGQKVRVSRGSGEQEVKFRL
jgi:hypothetical protein